MCPYIVSGNNMDLLSRDTWKTTFWNILSLTYISLHGAIQTIVTNYRIAVSDALFFVSKPHLLNMAPACSDAIKKCWAWVIFLSLFFHLLCSCFLFCVSKCWFHVVSRVLQGVCTLFTCARYLINLSRRRFIHFTCNFIYSVLIF